MTLLLISFVAGVLTVLAPCILPLLPVVIGSSVGARSKATPYIVIGSLALSILLFTYLLKASTALITIPPYVWTYISGGILFGFGLVLLFPQIWQHLSFVNKTNTGANKLMGTGHQKKSIWGDVLIGAALGPVFSTCSPTYFVILATVLPASFLLGTVYLLAYITGLVLVLILIALLGQKLVYKLQIAADGNSWFKKIIGLLFVLVGLAIMTGFDKKIETKILDTSYLNISNVEQKLLDKVEVEQTTNQLQNSQIKNELIPLHLLKQFTLTNWEKVNPVLANALSGGPPKDGIPALEHPTFIPLQESNITDTVQAIVLQSGNNVKVYPYNILVWHEIVNDTVDDAPVAITFCPLCGSAIVYDRTLPDGNVSTFGVSGSLLESNMIMYDRKTESLWQQSTGVALAGSHLDSTLNLYPFQLLTISDVRTKYPSAEILSTNTGHSRNYSNNPYGGYDQDNDLFIFPANNTDNSLPSKTIVLAFKAGQTPVAVPWLALREKGSVTKTINEVIYTISVNSSGEATITSNNTTIPFYFEMWFSFNAQHGTNGTLINL